MRKAQVYYEKSLQELEQFKLECFLERCRIYYNSAEILLGNERLPKVSF